jgi:NADH-quinone oxidoreductase subunit H
MIVVVWAERKISAFIQDRLGPMEVGYYGIGQTIADLIKLLFKEDIIPEKADKNLFAAAPVIIFVSVFAGYAVLPLGPDIIGSSVPTGVFYLLTIISLDVVGLMLAGWASHNKFSMLGSLRGISQIISYEVPLTLSVLSAVVICQSLNLQEISMQQGVYASEANYLFGIKSLAIDISQVGGFLTWNIFRAPILIPVFLIFFIASLAECNRAPFDIPEAESEIVAGFHTEYSGFRWALLFLGEYSMMLLICLLGAVLFLGSWNTPFPNMGGVKLGTWTSGPPGTIAGNLWGFFWIISKAFFLVFLQMMARWTYPRLRVDQLMNFCWKVLLPTSLILFFFSALWRLLMI